MVAVAVTGESYILARAAMVGIYSVILVIASLEAPLCMPIVCSLPIRRVEKSREDAGSELCRRAGGGCR